MKVLRLTDANNGGLLVIPVDEVVAVEEDPVDQTKITLSDGTTRQPKESVEQITKMLEAARE